MLAFFTLSLRRCFLIVAGPSLILVAGCAHASNTDRGIATGGILGAVAGTAIGAATGKPLAGAAIGGAVGAVAGGAHGASMDRMERRMEAKAAAAAYQAPTLQDIASLTKSGVSDDVIIGQIRNSGAVYTLSSQDLMYLTGQGVREPVIRELQLTARRPVRQVYTPVPVQPVYVVEPVPPPPSVGFGVTYIRRR